MTSRSNGAPLLEVAHVRKVFSNTGGLLSAQDVVALDDVSLMLQGDEAKLLTIVGESGSGKSTLARCILGLTPITEGSIRYRGQEISQMNRTALHEYRRAVQPVFQDPYATYNPFYRIDRVLNMIVRKFKLASSTSEATKLIDEALRAVDLRPHDVLGRYPHQLSGGQRQRIMVARALLLNPKIILADEPVSMVDASLRATILESLLKLKRELGISLVYITHDLTTAYQVSENIYILYRGSVAEVGSVDKVIKEPLHPYTQLLVRSIPLPDPDLHWGGEGDLERKNQAANGAGSERRGCKFADRCPFVMPECRQSPPPLYRTNDDRAVACYLYKEHPVIRGGEMADVLAT